MNEESYMFCLLPTGSADEKIRGISHLFEHVLISKIVGKYKPLRIKGLTTEDYVIIYVPGLTSGVIIGILKHMPFEKEEIDHHKQDLLREIKRESPKGEEAFFSFVWRNTAYEKSPLGTTAGIKTVTPGMLEELREEILRKHLFFYNPTTGLEIVNGHGYKQRPSQGIDTPRRRNTTFQGRCYDIFYFNDHIEPFYLLTGILKNLNPGKHIQLSEKKNMSALIFEKGTIFPGPRNIGSALKETRQQLHRDIAEIKANLSERALNELESYHFYGKPWQDRIVELDRTTERRLLDLVSELSR